MWQESWGEMIWGAGSGVPLLGPSGLVALALGVALAGALLLWRGHRWGAGVALLALLLTAPAVALALTLPHTFANGTVADADEVNENFAAVGNAIVPVGGVVAWLGSLPGAPSLPANFAPCDGQVVSDAESPLDGTTLPDLNGEHRFLRGADSSGATGGADAVALTTGQLPSHDHGNGGYDRLLAYTGGSGTSCCADNTPNQPNLLSSAPLAPVGNGEAHENRPSFYEVVWVIRIK